MVSNKIIVESFKETQDSIKDATTHKQLLWLYSSMPSTDFALTNFPFPVKFYACRIKAKYWVK